MSPRLVFVGHTLFTALLFHWMPALTRPELLFGVTVPVSFARTDEARRIVARYRALVWLVAMVALTPAAVGWRGEVALAVSQAVQLGGVLLAYLAARQQVLPHAVAPSQLREASLAPRPRGLPGGWPAQLGPLALLAVAATGHKASWPVVGSAAAVCALLTVMAVALERGSRRIVAGGAAGDAERDFKRGSLMILVGAQYLVALRVALLALVDPDHLGWLPLVETGLVLAVMLALVRLGQGGSRRAAPAAEVDGPVADRTRDAQWIGGLVYFNRDDPALFVERRFGLGYTLNLGHLKAWALVALVAAVLVASLLLTSGKRPNVTTTAQSTMGRE